MEDNKGLKTKQMAVGYKKKILLGDVSVQVQPGRILTLIGPNGSGKSTILKTLTGQLETLGGFVYLAGKDKKEMSVSEIAKTLGMVMTDRPTPELMDCREVVGTGRYPSVGRLGILGDKDWEKVDWAMEMVDIASVADKSFYEISDGQRQRVMLARALCQEPKILVLDEPTSYLDMKYKLDILETIRRLAKEQNIAVIMSLHELDLAMKISDEIACVDGERVSKIGTCEEIFSGTFIQELYGVEETSFHPLTGAMYPVAKKEEPKVFVIGGGGSGIHEYYRLFREGIPFVAGILMENDLEMPVAKALASDVIYADAFQMMGEEQLQAAKKQMDACEQVLCPLTTFGSLNQANQELKKYAERQGKLK